MEIIFWVIIAIVAISIRSNKKRQEEAKKKARENAAWTGQPAGTQPPPRPTVSQEVWPWAQAAPTPKAPIGEGEGEGEWPWTQAAPAGKPPIPVSQEGWPWPQFAPAAPQPRKETRVKEQWAGEGAATMEGQTQEGDARQKAAPHIPLTSTLAHTLRPATQGRSHAHQETSMTGVESCPPKAQTELPKTSAIQREKQRTARERALLTNVLRMDRESIVTGLLYMEILGKPKSMQHSRLYTHHR